jgi:drug/metabolite transporter (DMT)-like permease
LTPFELGLVLVSALLHALWSASIKASGDPLVFNAWQEAAPLAAGLVLLPLLNLGEIPPEAWRLVAATGLAHGLYFYWMSRAFEHGDLTLVYPIARSTPAFLPLLAVPLFGESITIIGGLGIATVVAGIWLLQLDQGLRLQAFLGPAARFAYLTLAATVAYSLIDKGAMAALAEAPWTSPLPRFIAYSVLLWFANGLVFLPLVLYRRGGRALWRGRSSLGPATLATTVSFAGYALILKAYETAPVSYVVAVRQTSVLFALLLGVLWLREEPSRMRLLGAGATVVGVGLIALFS